MKQTAIGLTLLLLASTAAFAGQFDGVDAAVETAMKNGRVAGAAIVIAKDNKVVHERAFGVVSAETQAPASTKTLFRLGSTAKMFVALATLQLVDAGKLRLDQQIGEVVPGLNPALRKITAEQLLTHTAGLADEAPMNGPLDESALHERVTSWSDEMILGPPGEVFSYANTGYALLGDVIAHASGQPFTAAMQSLVFDRMGMKDSTYRPLVAMTRPLAVGHDGNGVIRPAAEHAGNYPPGSLFTSVEDLGRFFSALSWETLERLAKPRAAIVAQDRSYGYGIITDVRYGPRILLHPGGRSGYGSTFMFLPQERVAIAVIANRTAATLSSAAFAAIESFVKLGSIAPKSGSATLSASDIAALSGSYANGRMLPTVELVAHEGGLGVRVGGRTLAARLTAPDRFRVEGGGQLETFVIVRDEKGAPRYLCAETHALRKRS